MPRSIREKKLINYFHRLVIEQDAEWRKTNRWQFQTSQSLGAEWIFMGQLVAAN
jgi:hypothetical protein